MTMCLENGVNGALPVKRPNAIACVNSAFLHLQVKAFREFYRDLLVLLYERGLWLDMQF